MLKKMARTCLAVGCTATGLVRWAEDQLRRSLTILCYHRILPWEQKYEYFNPDLAVTPEVFREHCRILKERFYVLPLSHAYQMLKTNEKPDRPVVAITFDDGYRDNYHRAGPILDEFKLPATFFVITNLVGSDQAPWYDRLARAAGVFYHAEQRYDDFERNFYLPKCETKKIMIRQMLEYAKRHTSKERMEMVEFMEKGTQRDSKSSEQDLIMDWEQLNSLAAEGHEIGSHSQTHEILNLFDDYHLKDELEGSRRTLEEKLNVPIRTFCYPNGDCDDRVRRAVADAGYTCAVTTQTGNNFIADEAFGLKRRFIHEERMTHLLGRKYSGLFRMELSGLADFAFRRQRRSVK